jgi:signal transduction histidine kinase
MVEGGFGCRVELAEPRAVAMVRGDRVRLAQAVGNLVANALEHGDGRVQLQARAQGDRVRIEVADEGPGLPVGVGDLARRARAGRGRRGRGLAIAADIADRHGGRLVAAPAAHGARVALELPAWRDPA